jgi:prephenate dehydrogenase
LAHEVNEVRAGHIIDSMHARILTIVGVGLIGGSIGLAAKRRGVASRVRGLGRRKASLDDAQSIGAIDDIHLEPAPALHDADLVILCTPVDQIAEQALRFAPLCKPGALFTDAGSTKGHIVDLIEGRLPDGIEFVGSHPLAGSEKKGAGFADADLFQDRWTVVTPTPHTNSAALEKIIEFWSSLGAKVRSMPPHEHDQALAVTSHLPHLLAAALAGILPDSLHSLTATGFRDTTRIAAGAPELWTAIFMHNREALLHAYDLVHCRMKEFRRALEEKDGEALDRLLLQAKSIREKLG